MKFASAIAVTGFATKLNNKFLKISAKLPGACNSEFAGISKNNVLGNMLLTVTAANADKNMPIPYITIIGLILALPPLPTVKLAIDAKTSTKTKIGATDFNALMNKSPRILKYGAT